MVEILIGIAILGGLGLVFGLVLSAASKVFYVQTDPRLDQLNACLPGANCGGCGYAGCGGYAEAVLNGEAAIGLCASGGNECAQAMGEIMGVKVGEVVRKVALVRCSGYKGMDADGNVLGAKMKAEYEGFHDCVAASKVGGNGPLACKFGCLGFGNCVKACKYDAIRMVDGVAKVDPEKCTGCMACAKQCPRELIIPVDYDKHVVIACASHAKGAVTVRGCSQGCIGCGLCVKICPHDAIKVENNLATIDYAICTSCGLCAAVCPKKLISSPVDTPEEILKIVKEHMKAAKAK